MSTPPPDGSSIPFTDFSNRGVIVRPVANYGMPNHLRVTVGGTDENARFLDALEKVLA